MNAAKNGLYTALIAGASLLPAFSFAQSGPNPGKDSKAQTEYVVNGKKYDDAGVAGLANSKGGQSMSVVVYKGQDNAHLDDKTIIDYMENDMRSKGANGRCFVYYLGAKQSGYVFYVNGRGVAPDIVNGDEFDKYYNDAVKRQVGLSTNSIANDNDADFVDTSKHMRISNEK